MLCQNVLCKCPSAPVFQLIQDNFTVTDAFIALGQSRGQLLHLFNPPRGRELNKMFKVDWPSLIWKVLKTNIRTAKNKGRVRHSNNIYLHSLTAMFPNLFTDMA